MDFYTVCPHCKHEHAMMNAVRDKRIVCSRCDQAFVATAIDRPEEEPIRVGAADAAEINRPNAVATAPNDLQIETPPRDPYDQRIKANRWQDRVYTPATMTLEELEESRAEEGSHSKLLLAMLIGFAAAFVGILVIALILLFVTLD